MTTSERVTECKSDQETLVTLSWSVRPIPLITSTFSGCQWWCAGQRLPCQHHRHYQHCHRYHRLAKGSFQKLLGGLGVGGEGTPLAEKIRQVFDGLPKPQMKNLSNSKYSMSSSSVCLCSQSTILATRLKQDQKILKERKNQLQIQKTSSNTCTQARSAGFQSRFSSSCQCHHPLSTGSPPRIE